MSISSRRNVASLPLLLVIFAFLAPESTARADVATDAALAKTVVRNVPQMGGGPVRILYVVPSDRRERQDFVAAMTDAAREFQTWLGARLGGRTIRLASPAVAVVHSRRNAAWFTGEVAPLANFWIVTTNELSGLGLIKHKDPGARYLVFVDVDLRCGQSGAGGDGVAVLEANNLRGLVGEPIVPACADRTGADVQRRDRWIGGIGHELLHALGLGHADQDDDCRDAACQDRALMKFGYVRYPNADLRPQDKLFLLGSKSIFPN